MPRTDIADYLIHFTSDTTSEAAYLRLKKIVTDRTLLGTGNKIRGGYRCVCFSEAPLPSLNDGLVNPDSYSKYSPFGLMFHKRWIFSKGGRPVIYQTSVEFEDLPESLRWRHQTYEPTRDPLIDFTWEREWRVNCDSLEFGPREAVIVVLDRKWVARLVSEHEREQEFKVMQYCLVLDEDLARMYYEPFPWHVVTLRG
jgi:hypothetical protein